MHDCLSTPICIFSVIGEHISHRKYQPRLTLDEYDSTLLVLVLVVNALSRLTRVSRVADRAVLPIIVLMELTLEVECMIDVCESKLNVVALALISKRATTNRWLDILTPRVVLPCLMRSTSRLVVPLPRASFMSITSLMSSSASRARTHREASPAAQCSITSLTEAGPGCFSTKTTVFLSPWISMPFSVALKYLSQAPVVRNLTTAKSDPGAGIAMDSSLPPQTRA
jgi:hypothetical protein